MAHPMMRTFSVPRLHIVKKKTRAEEEDEVLVSNVDGVINVVGPYPRPQEAVPVIAARDEAPGCPLLQETARQGACVWRGGGGHAYDVAD